MTFLVLTLKTFLKISQWGNIISLFSPHETDFAIKTFGQFCFSCSKVTLGDGKTSKKSFKKVPVDVRTVLKKK